MPAGQEKPPWGVARPAAGCAFYTGFGRMRSGLNFPHVIARVARPVAIRAPALPPTSNAVRGIRIATGINALAMTWENIPGCGFTSDWGKNEVGSVADRPGGRSLQVRTMYGVRKKTRAAARVFSYALSCFFSSLNTSRWTGIRSCLGLWELYHTRMRPANSGLTRGISGRVNPWAAYIYQ